MQDEFEDDEEFIDSVLAQWGTPDSNDLLCELLNDEYSQSDSLASLCDGDYDNAQYLEVVKFEQTDSAYKATVSIEFDKVTSPACKDWNNLEHQTALVLVTIDKENPEYIEIEVAETYEPDRDYI